MKRKNKSPLSKAMSSISKGRWDHVSAEERSEISRRMHEARYGKKK